MPAIDVYNLNREKTGTMALADTVFDVEVREHLFHEAVRAQMAAKRSGTAKVKERGEIVGSTAKVYRQKGTGRARQGDKKGNHCVGGGVAHGPRPRAYNIKVNKKTRRAALCAALSRRQQEGRLVVVDGFELAKPRTKEVMTVLTRFELDKALIVDAGNENLALGARNLPRANYLDPAGLNVYDVLKHDTLVMTRQAVEELEGRLGK